MTTTKEYNRIISEFINKTKEVKLPYGFDNVLKQAADAWDMQHRSSADIFSMSVVITEMLRFWTVAHMTENESNIEELKELVAGLSFITNSIAFEKLGWEIIDVSDTIIKKSFTDMDETTYGLTVTNHYGDHSVVMCLTNPATMLTIVGRDCYDASNEAPLLTIEVGNVDALNVSASVDCVEDDIVAIGATLNRRVPESILDEDLRELVMVTFKTQAKRLAGAR